MMLLASLKMALRSIGRNMLRSLLTVLGVVIGVAAVITMLALGNGATRSVSQQIESMGTNLIMVMPGQRFGPGADSAPPFKSTYLEQLRTEVPSAAAIAPVVNKTFNVVHQARSWSTSVTGTDNGYFEAGNWQMADGRAFFEAELRSGKAVCVLGETVRQKLFDDGNPIGGKIRIQQFSCEVVGLLKSKGQSAMGSDQDDTVVLPMRTVQRRLTGNLDVHRLSVSVRDGISLETAKAEVTSSLRHLRNIAANEEDDFRVLDTRQLSETLTSTTRIMTLLLGAVAAVSLLVGGIGIMNIMLVSVTERTREIGIRLAIGALERDVLMQFLIESVVLSSLGGLVGIGLAAASSMGLAGLMQIGYEFDPTVNAVAFLFASAIGVVFGFFPARRAARLNPIEALRYE